MSISGISKYTELDDYNFEKRLFVDKKVANLKNSVDIIKSGGKKLFPITINAIKTYKVEEGTTPKNIAVLKEYIKDDTDLLKQLNAEIETHNKYFEKIADVYWRDHVVLKIIESVGYKPKRAGEDGRFIKALHSKFAEYLEDKYIKDIDFVNESLELGLFNKHYSDALGDELEDTWYASMDDLKKSDSFRKRGEKLKADLPGTLEEREGVETALLASKLLEAGLNSSSNSNNTSNVEKKRGVTARVKAVTKGAESPKVKNAATAKLKKAAAAKPAAPAKASAAPAKASAAPAKASAEKPRRRAENESNNIFSDLTEADVRNLRSIESLNAFIGERFNAIPAGDKIKKKPENVFKFMGYKGLAAGNPLQQLKEMYQIVTSGNGSDCLIHTFLTMTCEAFRKLPDQLKDPVARSFRHDLYPRFAEVAAAFAKRGGKEHRDRIFTVHEFLNDTDIGWLTDIYRINAIIFQSSAVEMHGVMRGQRQPAIITFIESVPGEDVYTFSNAGNNHYESVQNTTEPNPFTISYELANQLKAEGQKQLPAEAKVTGCRFNTGDRIKWDGHDWRVLDRSTEGGTRCLHYIIADEDNYDIFMELPQGTRNSKPDKWVKADGTNVIAQSVNADEIHAQNPGGGGGRHRHTRRKGRRGQGLKSRRLHSFRNPR